MCRTWHQKFVHPATSSEFANTEFTLEFLGIERYEEADGLIEDAADLSGLNLAEQPPVIEDDEIAELHGGKSLQPVLNQQSRHSVQQRL